MNRLTGRYQRKDNGSYFKYKAMQITERNYPVLRRLKTGKMGVTDVGIIDRETIMLKIEGIRGLWEVFCEDFNHKIFYICKSMEKAVFESAPKLQASGCLDEIHKERHKGTILFGKWQVCFDLHNQLGVVMAFYENQLAYVHCSEFRFITKNIGMKDGEVFEPVWIFDIIWASLLFMKFAKVETKEMGKMKKEVFNNEKYVNNSTKDIVIVDCLWITNLIRSGAFKVRGHFRLQPYKDRKELVWISEFEKSGYTRKAKSLSYNNIED